MNRRCDMCDASEACRHTFGSFWHEKSRGGVGCDHKPESFDIARVKADEAAALAASAAAEEEFKSKYSGARKPSASSYIYHKYVVTHNGIDHVTAARSEDEAINSVRWRLYGATRMCECGEFSARQVESGFDVYAQKKKPSRIDIMERINNMMKSRYY